MYVSSFCKLMKINVFIFSQHGIKAKKEFENTRIRVSSCGQFRQPIQRPCHTPFMLQSSRSLTEVKPSSEHLAVDNFFRRPPFRPESTPIGASLSNLPSGGSLVGKYLPTSPHAPISGPTLKLTWVRHYLDSRLLQEVHLPSTSHSTPSAPSSPEKPSFFTFSL